MKRLTNKTMLLAVIMSAAQLQATRGDNTFELSWYTIDGGGMMYSTSGPIGNFEFSGTIGQLDAGNGMVDASDTIELEGGFWAFADSPSAVPCVTNVECVLAEANACTFEQCSVGFCTSNPVEFGNVNGSTNQTPNLDDILCVLAGFGNFSNCPNADIAPTNGPNACQGNGTINLDDLLAVLAAFAGADPCGCIP